MERCRAKATTKLAKDPIVQSKLWVVTTPSAQSRTTTKQRVQQLLLASPRAETGTRRLPTKPRMRQFPACTSPSSPSQRRCHGHFGSSTKSHERQGKRGVSQNREMLRVWQTGTPRTSLPHEEKQTDFLCRNSLLSRAVSGDKGL